MNEIPAAVVFKPLGSEAISVISLRRASKQRKAIFVIAKAKNDKERDEARGYTNADLAEVSDNPEWTPEMFARAKPFAEVFPDLAASIRRGRGSQKAPVKKAISLRLDQDVIDYYKASGAGWQVRMGEALRKAAGL